MPFLHLQSCPQSSLHFWGHGTLLQKLGVVVDTRLRQSCCILFESVCGGHSNLPSLPDFETAVGPAAAGPGQPAPERGPGPAAAERLAGQPVDVAGLVDARLAAALAGVVVQA